MCTVTAAPTPPTQNKWINVKKFCEYVYLVSGIYVFKEGEKEENERSLKMVEIWLVLRISQEGLSRGL